MSGGRATATLTHPGTLIVHGRSDGVLNPGGVRIGTAELYRHLEKIDEVVESARRHSGLSEATAHRAVRSAPRRPDPR